MLLPASSFNAPLEALPLRVTPAARLRSLCAGPPPLRLSAALHRALCPPCCKASGFLLKGFAFFLARVSSLAQVPGNRQLDLN